MPVVHGIVPDFRRWYYGARSIAKESETDGLQAGRSAVGIQRKLDNFPTIAGSMSQELTRRSDAAFSFSNVKASR